VKWRLVLEVAGVRRQELKVERPKDLVGAFEQVEHAIGWCMQGLPKCRALVVTVHVDGEGCDHE